MKTQIKVILFIGFLGTNAFAGGSSTVGPGAPKFEYQCLDESRTISVDVASLPPSYNRFDLTVQDLSNQQLETEAGVVRILGSNAGAGLQFKGERFVLSVASTSPRFQDGKIYFAAFILDGAKPQSANTLHVMCERILN